MKTVALLFCLLSVAYARTQVADIQEIIDVDGQLQSNAVAAKSPALLDTDQQIIVSGPILAILGGAKVAAKVYAVCKGVSWATKGVKYALKVRVPGPAS